MRREDLRRRATPTPATRAPRFACVRYGNVVGSRGSVDPALQGARRETGVADDHRRAHDALLDHARRRPSTSCSTRSSTCTAARSSCPKIPSMRVDRPRRGDGARTPSTRSSASGPARSCTRCCSPRTRRATRTSSATRYVILPEHAIVATRSGSRRGEPLADGFRYTSRHQRRVARRPTQLRAMLADARRRSRDASRSPVRPPVDHRRRRRRRRRGAARATGSPGPDGRGVRGGARRAPARATRSRSRTAPPRCTARPPPPGSARATRSLTPPLTLRRDRQLRAATSAPARASSTSTPRPWNLDTAAAVARGALDGRKASSPVSLAGLPGRPRRRCSRARARRDRDRGRRPRARRQPRRHGPIGGDGDADMTCFSLPPGQDDHHRRGRRRHDRTTTRSPSSCALPHPRHRAPAETGRRPLGPLVLRDRRARLQLPAHRHPVRARRQPAAPAPGLVARATRSPRATTTLLDGDRRRRRCRPAPADGDSTATTCSSCASTRAPAAPARSWSTGCARRGIGTQLHYIPIYRHSLYRELGYGPRGDARCPNAERYYETALSLPMFPGITDADIERVGAEIERLLEEPVT